ncbi:MAG: hypothetical protein LBL08_00450 [Candidatus Nomurabacteria bacterium]|nr:hypothetical protein [Candidatus Nomurabacteria bacterium]
MVSRIARGGADFGLCGSDRFGEGDSGGLVFEKIRDLPCRFALLGRAGETLPDKMTVATSFPNGLQKFMVEENLRLAETIVVNGKAESYPATGETNAAFDIVETGASAQANNLEIARLAATPITLGGLWGRQVRDADSGEAVEGTWSNGQFFPMSDQYYSGKTPTVDYGLLEIERD